MLGGYHAITLTHKHLPVETVGHLVLPEGEDRYTFLAQLKSNFQWEELLYLATCNRVLYFFYSPSSSPSSISDDFLDYLATYFPGVKNNQAKLKQGIQVYKGGNAVRHLFNVASSMDSMVLGEREIFRQLRQSYNACNAAGLTGDHLRLAMDQAVSCAKQVYTDTSLGQKSISIVSLAVQKMLEQKFRSDARIAIVGAGQTNQLFGRFLKKYGYHNVFVFNRTLEKAHHLVETIRAKNQDNQGRAFSLGELNPFLDKNHMDLILVCTSSTEYILKSENLSTHNPLRNQASTLIDLSIPANIDSKLAEDYGHRLINVQSLQQLADKNLAFRQKAAADATKIISEHVEAYKDRWHQRQVERSLSDIPKGIQEAKNKTIEIVFQKELAGMDEETQAKVLSMLNYLEKKSIAVAMKTMIDINKKHGNSHMQSAQGKPKMDKPSLS